MPLEARVKSVLSGDTVVLSHVTNPTQERILSLAYVSAPRLRREGDEVGICQCPIIILVHAIGPVAAVPALCRVLHCRRVRGDRTN